MNSEAAQYKSTLENYIYVPSELAKKSLLFPYSTGRFICEDAYRFGQPLLGGYVLCFLLKGELTLYSSGASQTLTPGSVLLLPADEKLDFGTASSFDALWMHFDGQGVDGLYAYIKAQVGNPLKPSNPKKIKKLLKEILSAVSQKKELTESELSIKLYTLLLECANVPKKQVKNHRAYEASIEEAEAYIQANLRMPLKVKDIAKQVHMSPSHFSKVFKEMTDYSPYEYVLNARLNAAKKYLTETDMSIEQIAFYIGFNSESNFIYFFTSNVGIPPKKFRKQAEHTRF